MHSHKKRRGRGRPRQDRPTIDRGTQELQKKRWALLGRNCGDNGALAESLLGIFYGRHLITKPLYEAGCFFGELGYRYEPCLGHKLRQNASSLSVRGLEPLGSSPLLWPEEYVEKRTQAWKMALRALKQAGAEPYKIVLDVVFYDGDLYTMPIPSAIFRAMPSLQKGLESLESYFKGELRGGRGKRSGLGLSLEKSTIFQLPSKESRSYHPA